MAFIAGGKVEGAVGIFDVDGTMGRTGLPLKTYHRNP
jgi:hypothetical protein